MTTETRHLAEKLFLAQSDYVPGPCSRRPQLSDLWPCDQQKYEKMAETLLRERDR